MPGVIFLKPFRPKPNLVQVKFMIVTLSDFKIYSSTRQLVTLKYIQVEEDRPL
jgi:hypothetical protein